MIADQLPDEIDDAIKVLECLTALLATSANSVDLSDLILTMPLL